ncbi:Protein CBG19744 [Caenorhabditis briggsae]|uniref:Protein CBG19744 n=1 Tax=Caenorhabditis briggsae TaxID=6238 RepID=A8XWF0_CAEBR|nr:Protein CBG19744 [Caenorhabditis briggsae]CAP36969.2 Protein CBG19744 [Caenorhabditis briggsae]
MSLCLEKQKIRCGMLSRTARHIAIDENGGKMAVVRKSRTPDTHDYIEFYNILSSWLAVPELTVCPENGSIENLLFVKNGELMTAHANGSVCFIDPHNNARVKRIQISASTIWAACKHGDTSIAMISHSSVLYFFDVSSKMITSSISLGVESRLFDVSSNGTLVAIGSIDGVILAGDGKVQQTLKLDRQNRRDPTIAWSVLFVKPNLLACGDSRGTVTLWNVQDGSLTQTISSLQSHILTMVATEDGSFHVAGVDPRITELKETDGQFTIVNRRNGPVRDVRSMAVYENTVYAAGEDFDIFVGKSGCRKLLLHQQKNLIVSGDVVASAGENFIDVFWKQQGEDEPTEGSNVLQNGFEVRLLEMREKNSRKLQISEKCPEIIKSNPKNTKKNPRIHENMSEIDEKCCQIYENEKKNQHYEMIHLAKIYSPKKRIITSWSISSCGQYLVIGTSNDTTIYKILPLAKKLSKKILKHATLDGGDSIATSFCVTRENRLYVARNDFEIVEYDVTKENGKEKRVVISQNDCGSVIRMSASPCGKYLCVLTTRSQVFAISVESGESRLLKVDLPIDLILNSTSAFVLSSITSGDSNQDTKKVFHEVGLSNGLVKRSACSNQLRMIPSSPKSIVPGQPIYVMAITASRIMTVSYDGHWSILDVDAGTVFSAQDGPLKANKKAIQSDRPALLYTGIRLREESESSASDFQSAAPAKRTRRTSVRSSVPDAFQSLNSRVVQLEVSGDETPKTANFKLKKFGMQ